MLFWTARFQRAHDHEPAGSRAVQKNMSATEWRAPSYALLI